MASGKWERVGKGGKPANKSTGQQKSHKNTKDSDKPLDGSQLTDIVKINQTKFSSFNDDHAESSAPPTSAPAAVASNRSSRVEGKKQPVEKKKAQTNKEPRPPTISLKDAMDKLDADDIKEFIEQAQEQYPDDSLAWFKELIGYFRQRLPSDHMFKESENIVSMVPMETRKILIGCFKALKEKTLELLFIHALNDITTLSHKGANIVAVQLLVELLKLSHPSIVDQCTEMAQVMLQSCISRPRESVPLLRAILLDNFQQQHNTKHGIKAWCKVLLPLMRNPDNVPRQLVTFAVNYSYELFAAGLRHPPALPLTAAEFVSLLQTATPTQVAGDQVMVKKFSQLMLHISGCVVTLDNNKPSQCFERLLWTLEKHNEPRPPQQLLRSTMLCVSHDTQCQNLWKNHRHSNRANRLLIQYIAHHWDEAERFAVQHECLDGLLAVLRSPNIVAMTTVDNAPWNKPIRGAHNVSSTSSHVVSNTIILVVFLVVLLLLGNYLCQHNNDSTLCVYIENVMVSIKWMYSHLVSIATSLQSWLLSNIPYWDSVSSVGYQLIMAIVKVYATAGEMLVALWQVLLNCWEHIHMTMILTKS